VREARLCSEVMLWGFGAGDSSLSDVSDLPSGGRLGVMCIMDIFILGTSYISPGLSYISPAKAALGLITPHSLATRATVHFYA
jgi:hypothetical protein